MIHHWGYSLFIYPGNCRIITLQNDVPLIVDWSIIVAVVDGTR